MIAAAAAAKT